MVSYNSLDMEKGTLVILYVRNANHDGEKFMVKAMDDNDVAEIELKRLSKQADEAYKKWTNDCATGEETYVAADSIKESGKPIYAIVNNELSNSGCGCGVYGIATSREEAIENYRKHIKRYDDFWHFDTEKPKSKILDTDKTNGILIQDYATAECQCSMEFACVKLIPNGSEVEVEF